MMVRAYPSVSACHAAGNVGSDWIRKLVMLAIILAVSTEGTTKMILLMVGILLACIVFFSNLGARVWYFFNWDPLRYDGPFASALAYMAAVGTGFAVPFLAQRTTSKGGKVAIESIIGNGVLLAICFIITDLDEVQSLLAVGESDCRQDSINMFAGIWLSLTILASLFIAARNTPIPDYTYDGEQFLIQDQQSPVGYKVPAIPDFPVDPRHAKTGINKCSKNMELVIGVLVACIIGFAVVSLSFLDWKDTAIQSISQWWMDLV